METEPFDYQLVIRYLDDSASEEDRRQARELLLRSPEARAFLMEVAGQMAYLIDRHQAFVELPLSRTVALSCPLDGSSDAVMKQRPWPGLFNQPSRRRLLAASLLFMAALFFSTIALMRNGRNHAQQQPSLHLADYLGDITVIRGPESFKSPFREQPQFFAGDIIESSNWLSWAELKLDSGSTLTVLVGSKLRIKSLTMDRMELELYSGAVRIKSETNNPMQFLVHSDRLQVATAGSDTLVWDYNFSTALGAVFSGTAEVNSTEGSEKWHVAAGWMATRDYNDAECQISRHPEVTHGWSSRGMISSELGTGIWKNPEQDGLVKLLAAPKSYNFPNGKFLQIDEIQVAAWRRPGLIHLKAGSRLVVTGKLAKPGPATFAIRTHSEYGKLLDIFEKTVEAEKLAAPGETWRVEIPVEQMQSTFKPGQNPFGSVVFNISAYTSEKIGLEVNSIELIPPDPSDSKPMK